MNALALDLATDLEKIAAAIAFAVHCLRDEGLEADEALADFVLWNCTGFPSFWRVGTDGAHPIECCSTQVRKWARVAQLSREKAGRMLDDPTYSADDALMELEAEGTATTTRILEDD